MEISPERSKYHELLLSFEKLLAPGSTVYDIGKSTRHDYRPIFSAHDFKVLDRDEAKRPDIVIDVEKAGCYGFSDFTPDQVDAILCNGVIEQCDDPMQLIRSCNILIKPSGIILFGFCLLGYPLYDNDHFRFTARGATKAISRAGLTILKTDIVQRNGAASYIYVLAKKTV